MKSFRDYLGLSNLCSYDVDDVIGRADRFGFQNFCSPAARSLRTFNSMCTPLCLLNFIEDYDPIF